MPIPGLTTIALAVTRLAYRLAEKKRWLPGGAFHRMSVDQLKAGDLDEAERLNRLALERKPQHNKALVVRDLIAMRRDASTAELRKKLDEEQERIRVLQAERLACRWTLARGERRRQRKKLATWLLVPLSAAGALATGYAVAQDGFPLWGRIVAGVLGAGIVIVLVLPRFIGGGVEAAVREEECRAAMVTLSREIASRLKRTADLERQLVDMARVNQ
jgi:hypothetical protein